MHKIVEYTLLITHNYTLQSAPPHSNEDTYLPHYFIRITTVTEPVKVVGIVVHEVVEFLHLVGDGLVTVVEHYHRVAITQLRKINNQAR